MSDTRGLWPDGAGQVRLEGRQVTVGLKDGTRLSDCLVVSTGRNRTASLWLVADGVDTFVAVDDVADISEASASIGR
jgi:hypothetical protein